MVLDYSLACQPLGNEKIVLLVDGRSWPFLPPSFSAGTRLPLDQVSDIRRQFNNSCVVELFDVTKRSGIRFSQEANRSIPLRPGMIATFQIMAVRLSLQHFCFGHVLSALSFHSEYYTEANTCKSQPMHNVLSGFAFLSSSIMNRCMLRYHLSRYEKTKFYFKQHFSLQIIPFNCWYEFRMLLRLCVDSLKRDERKTTLLYSIKTLYNSQSLQFIAK